MSDDASEPATAALAARVAAELARQSEQSLDGGLYLVATPIGNLGDITVRALATLARADLICCEDTRRSRILLAHYGISRPLRAYHEHNAAIERPKILAALAEGTIVALISDAGTPLLSDPGYKLVREALRAGIRVTGLPGPSAILAGLMAAGLPTDKFLFCGFLPAKAAACRTALKSLMDVAATLVFFEAPSRLAAATAAIAAHLPGRDVAVARELTKRFEEVRRGTAAEIAAWAEAAGDIKGEIVILVGPPAPREVGDADIAAYLDHALTTLSLRDAARAVADDLGVARSRVYELGLRRRAEPR